MSHIWNSVNLNFFHNFNYNFILSIKTKKRYKEGKDYDRVTLSIMVQNLGLKSSSLNVEPAYHSLPFIAKSVKWMPYEKCAYFTFLVSSNFQTKFYSSMAIILVYFHFQYVPS